MKRFIYKHRGNTAGFLDDLNPVPLQREIVIEEDTGNFKIGDGSTPWRDLDYFFPNESGVSYDDIPSLSLLYENAKV